MNNTAITIHVDSNVYIPLIVDAMSLVVAAPILAVTSKYKMISQLN